MEPKSTFIIDLSGYEITSDETLKIQDALTSVIVKHLKATNKGKAFLKDKVAIAPGLVGYTPNPDWPYPLPWPPFPLPGPFPGFRALDKRLLTLTRERKIN